MSEGGDVQRREEESKAGRAIEGISRAACCVLWPGLGCRLSTTTFENLNLKNGVTKKGEHLT